MKTCLTESEVRELLAVSTPTLWRLRKRGEIRATKVGRLVRFLAKDVDDFLKRNREAPRRD